MYTQGKPSMERVQWIGVREFSGNMFLPRNTGVHAIFPTSNFGSGKMRLTSIPIIF